MPFMRQMRTDLMPTAGMQADLKQTHIQLIHSEMNGAHHFRLGVAASFTHDAARFVPYCALQQWIEQQLTLWWKMTGANADPSAGSFELK